MLFFKKILDRFLTLLTDFILQTELMGFMHFGLTGSKSQRIQSWITRLLEQANGTEGEYGVIANIAQSENGPRSLMGPLPQIRNLSPQIMVRTNVSFLSFHAVVSIEYCFQPAIVAWLGGLVAHNNGIRNGIVDFFLRLIRDLELTVKEKADLFHRVQNARRRKFPNFRFREAIRQLNHPRTEKLPANLLYRWARRGEQLGEVVHDLIFIVSVS